MYGVLGSVAVVQMSVNNVRQRTLCTNESAVMSL